MRAIIIDDKDARALLDKMRLEAMETSIGTMLAAEIDTWHAIPESTRRSIISQLHRKWHYHLTTWLQEQGCNCVR